MAENRRIEDRKRELTHAIVTSPTFDPFGPPTQDDRMLKSLDEQQSEIIARIIGVERQLGLR